MHRYILRGNLRERTTWKNQTQNEEWVFRKWNGEVGGLELSGLAEDRDRSCKRGPSGSIKCGEYLEQLRTS